MKCGQEKSHNKREDQICPKRATKKVASDGWSILLLNESKAEPANVSVGIPFAK
jgi:hypothetical protein